MNINCSYYLTDHLGSTRAVVDNNGNVLETFDYYPFGLLMPKRNTAGANTLEKFTGKERDEEGGLNLDYFGGRFYDSVFGRWTTPDPLADRFPHLSPYAYVENDPVNYFDPNGLYRIAAVGHDTKGVLLRVHRTSVGGARGFETINATLGFVPMVGQVSVFTKLATQGLNRDPSWQGTGWDYFGILGGGAARYVEKTRKILGQSLEAGVATLNFGAGLTDLFVPDDVGLDAVLFNVATNFRTGGEGQTLFTSINSETIRLNTTIANSIEETEGLKEVEKFADRYLEGISTILKGIAKGNNLDFSTKQGRQGVLEEYNKNKDIYDYAIRRLSKSQY